MKLKNYIELILMAAISVIIGLEFNHSPNAQTLIIAIVLYLALRYDIPVKILSYLEKIKFTNE
jgi:hypothetical protein|tara:strand:- start:1334 stop:1522 length:189 start_codon:yes stop_codon:yes gene_type:complete